MGNKQGFQVIELLFDCILNECVKLFSGQIPSVSRVAPTRYRHERACTEHSIESVKVCSAHENQGMNLKKICL